MVVILRSKATNWPIMMMLRLFEFETASSSTRANPSRRRLDRFLAFAMSKRKKSAKTLSLWERPAGAVSDPDRERYRHRHHHRRRVDRSWGWLGDAGSRHRDHEICRQQEKVVVRELHQPPRGAAAQPDRAAACQRPRARHHR